MRCGAVDVDYIIVGQGLAGSALALKLMLRGRRVMVVDNAYHDGASKVAAGVLNPVTGRWMVKTWNVDTVLPAAKNFYRQMEKVCAQPFFAERDILRLCRSAFETRRWEQRRRQDAYTAYVGEALAAGALWPGLHDPCGGFPILQGGWVDTPVWLDAAAAYLRERDAIRSTAFSHGDLQVTRAGVDWHGLRARRIVFCEGWGVRHNPWFRHLPLEPSKGEVLTVRGHVPMPGHILNAGKWIVPLPERTLFRIGSTWEWRHVDTQPTAKARGDLLRAAHAMLKDPVDADAVVEHQAGVRPASVDRLPWAGVHPRHPCIAIMNGLGAKGALYAPWLAECLMDSIEHGHPLPAEVDCARFAFTLGHRPQSAIR